jgi:hypothetical protein
VPCCDFIKPNYKEIKGLFLKKTSGEAIEFISQRINIYLKEGHNVAKKARMLTHHLKAISIINDYYKIAKKVKADGLYLGERLLSFGRSGVLRTCIYN